MEVSSFAPHRNRWLRILGVAFVMYVLSVIDRTNIAMAIPALRSELGIGAAAIGFATGMFFWGYIVLQIPAGRLASVWSAKWVIFSLLLFWSVVSLSTAFVRTEGQLIANRFILGVFEGGVLTCTIVLICETVRVTVAYPLAFVDELALLNVPDPLISAKFTCRLFRGTPLLNARAVSARLTVAP